MRALFSFSFFLTASLALPRTALTERSSSKAAYFLRNGNSTKNYLVAMPIMSNGELGEPVMKYTGGKGGDPITTLSTPAGIFFSASSVAVGSDYAFTVNSGDNTFSMFSIPSDDPTNLKLVDVANSKGDFPMSVAYSEALKMACVLNAGKQGGVACFQVSSKGLMSDGQGLRSLDKAFKQTNPPTGPANSVTQVAFDPKGKALWVIIKGDPTTTPLTPGDFIEYPVSNGKVATKGATSQVNDIILNFGTSFVSDSSFLIAAPTFGGAIVKIEDGTPKQTAKITVDGQLAICWSAYDPATGQGYLLDAGRTNVTVVDVASGKQLPSIIADLPNNNGTQGGLFDTAVIDSYAYSLADPNGVVVLDLKAGTQAQYFDLSSYGSRVRWEGMAVWPSQ